MANETQPNRYAPPTAEVSDAAEEVGELAGRGTRLVAVILDSLVGGLLIGVPLFIGLGIGGIQALSRRDPAALQELASGGLFAVVGLIVWAGINIYTVNKNGQSVGKKLMGIKVTRTDGSKAGLGRIFWLRNFVNGLIGAIPLIGGIYGLVDALMIFSEPRRCVHDHIADTIVVKA